VTVPVARASVRRTVRVAAALVAAQALLCGVIGWVTFGARHPHHPTAVPTVEPLAGKPLLIPPPVIAPPAPPRPPRPSASASTRKKVDAPPPSSPRPARRTRSSPPPEPVPEVRSSPAAQVSPSQQTALLPTALPDGVVQSPVKILDGCAPVNAKGLTADGISVTCRQAADGTLRWQIN
jgi:hypothetical protein